MSTRPATVIRKSRSPRRRSSSVPSGVEMPSRTVQGITRLSYRTPVPRTIAPLVGTAFPLRRDPGHADALGFPVAAHPNVLAPVPVPVAPDPEIAGTGLRRHHLASRRRRRSVVGIASCSKPTGCNPWASAALWASAASLSEASPDADALESPPADSSGASLAQRNSTAGVGPTCGRLGRSGS